MQQSLCGNLCWLAILRPMFIIAPSCLQGLPNCLTAFLECRLSSTSTSASVVPQLVLVLLCSISAVPVLLWSGQVSASSALERFRARRLIRRPFAWYWHSGLVSFADNHYPLKITTIHYHPLQTTTINKYPL